MERISACLIVHNEEKLIARCLDSLRGVVDEIILVHDGECSDRTLEIAEEYGVKIFAQPYFGFCEAHRPFCYEQASNNWILQIDADEFLSKELRNNLSTLVADNDVSAYELFWPLWDGKKEMKTLWPHKRCLFRKDKVSFLGVTHFVIEVNGEIKKIDLKLHHQPAYDNFSHDYFLKKQLPWAKLQAGYYLKDFSEIKKYNWVGTDWSRLVKYRVRFPLLLLPVEFVWTLFKNILSGAYQAGLLGLKSAYQAALYRATVNYYIYKLKK